MCLSAVCPLRQNTVRCGPYQIKAVYRSACTKRACEWPTQRRRYLHLKAALGANRLCLTRVEPCTCPTPQLGGSPPALDQLRVPVLIVTGRQDNTVPLAAVQKVATVLRRRAGGRCTCRACLRASARMGECQRSVRSLHTCNAYVLHTLLVYVQGTCGRASGLLRRCV